MATRYNSHKRQVNLIRKGPGSNPDGRFCRSPTLREPTMGLNALLRENHSPVKHGSIQQAFLISLASTGKEMGHAFWRIQSWRTSDPLGFFRQNNFSLQSATAKLDSVATMLLLKAYLLPGNSCAPKSSSLQIPLPDLWNCAKALGCSQGRFTNTIFIINGTPQKLRITLALGHKYFNGVREYYNFLGGHAE